MSAPEEVLKLVERFALHLDSYSHGAKIEEKPEVRKAGGVYYTPTYIYPNLHRRLHFVRHTLGKPLGEATGRATGSDTVPGSATIPNRPSLGSATVPVAAA